MAKLAIEDLDAYEKKKARDRERIARKRAEQKALIEMSPDVSPDKSPDVAISEEDIEEDKEKEKLSNDNFKKARTRHKYGEYQNVLLSDDDMEKLKAEFPSDYTERIERLSEYIASTGKSYKNHLATIRSWARKSGQTNSSASSAIEEAILKSSKNRVRTRIEPQMSTPSEPPKTAAEDPEVRKKMEALKERLGS